MDLFKRASRGENLGGRLTPAKLSGGISKSRLGLAPADTINDPGLLDMNSPDTRFFDGMWGLHSISMERQAQPACEDKIDLSINQSNPVSRRFADEPPKTSFLILLANYLSTHRLYV
jgi:hypothetical protein